MNTDIEFINNDSSKWWQIEKDDNGQFVWSSTCSSIQINDSNIQFINFKVEWHQFLSPEIVVKSNGADVRYQLSDGINELKISCSSSKYIDIISNAYVPSSIDYGSFDTRRLGVKIREITVYYIDDSYVILPLDEIPYIDSLENYVKLSNQLNSNGFIIDITKQLFFPKIFKPKKIAIFLYVEKQYKTIFETLRKYNISKKYELIILSDNPNVCEDDSRILKIDNCQIEHPSLNYKKTYAAAHGFINAVNIAKERNIELFFWLEWDCLVNKDYWFDILLDEHLSWKHDAIISGTPIATPTMHNNVKEGYNLHYLMQNYTSNYIKEAKVAMGSIPSSRNSMFFINGGLSFYKTSEMVEYFDKYDINIMRMGFDVFIGTKAFLKYGEAVFDKCAWLKSSFSGGNPYFIYTHEQRMNMLNSGLKIAIHPYKVL